MHNDKSKVGGPDRSRVAADEDYEATHLGATLGISSAEARKLIERFDNDRAAAETLKQRRQAS